MDSGPSPSEPVATPANPLPPTRPSASALLRGTGIVSALTLLSRILGFVRDLLVARLFGASLIADAFFVAFRIPNLLRSFVAEGAMTSAFVPVFTTELAKGQSAAYAAARSVSGLLLIFTSALALLGILYAPEVVMAIAPGFSRNAEKFELCVLLTRIMLPFVICVSLVALVNGALNSVHIFGASAWAQVWMNLTLIAGAIAAEWMSEAPAVQILAISVLVGGIIQVIVQIPALKRAGFSIVPSSHIFTPATRQVLRLMVPAILGATVYQLTVFLNTLFASVLKTGSVSWLFYADRLVQLPIGIFSVALASVLLPTLSRAAAQKDKSGFSGHLINSLRFTSFIIIPVSCGLALFAEPLTQVIFQRGAFNPESTVATAAAVRCYCWGIWAVSCHSMLVRGFIARQDTVTPTLIGILSLASNVLFSLLLMGPPLPESGWAGATVLQVQEFLGAPTLGMSLGHAGLALASSCSSWLALIVVTVLLNRKETIAWRQVLTPTLKSLAAALLACFVAAQLVAQFTALTQLIAGAALATLLFLVISFLLRNEELSETFSALSRLRKRRA